MLKATSTSPSTPSERTGRSAFFISAKRTRGLPRCFCRHIQPTSPTRTDSSLRCEPIPV